MAPLGRDGVARPLLAARQIHRGNVARLPANAHANPMTYAGAGGRQFVVVAAGGGGFSRDLSRTVSDTLIAFALPGP